jgi:glucan-binding YG repeat protein
MKGSLSVDVFIKRVEHILTNQNKINGNLYPECFSNHKCLPYNRYKSRALEKQLEFSITKEDYDNIIQKDCFLCGKQSDENNTNGIDRMDNNKGYVLDNINACCGECNFMKNVWEYNEFINKIVAIYEKNKDIMNSEENKDFVLENNIIPKNKTKKSIEEIKETNELFKQQQYEKIKEKYGDEEYKQMRVKEIAKYRSSNSI